MNPSLAKLAVTDEMMRYGFSHASASEILHGVRPHAAADADAPMQPSAQTGSMSFVSPSPDAIDHTIDMTTVDQGGEALRDGAAQLMLPALEPQPINTGDEAMREEADTDRKESLAPAAQAPLTGQQQVKAVAPQVAAAAAQSAPPDAQVSLTHNSKRSR